MHTYPEASLALADLLGELQANADVASLHTAAARMADHHIVASCDDSLFFADFFSMFGGTSPSRVVPACPADIHLDIHTAARTDYGWFRMSGLNPLPVDAREFSFSLNAERGTFEKLAVADPAWDCVAFRNTKIPALAFHGRDCVFALDSQWRNSILWYLFWRLLRIRSDAIFFHASAMGIFGEGTIFVGPAGAGKSTTSLGLAARGHNFLSDEIAGYIPEREELIPFRRPVGIKPGPRTTAVDRGLDPLTAQRIQRDGFVRIGIETLFPVAPPKALPLRRIVFLRGFAERPALERISAGRAEMVELQPLMSSFLNASHSRRIFELTRLLSSAKVYQLRLGNPDESASYIEKAFAQE